MRFIRYGLRYGLAGLFMAFGVATPAIARSYDLCAVLAALPRSLADVTTATATLKDKLKCVPAGGREGVAAL